MSAVKIWITGYNHSRAQSLVIVLIHFHDFRRKLMAWYPWIIEVREGPLVGTQVASAYSSVQEFQQNLTIERLNRTYKASYRKTNGFDTIDGANYDLALWVAYYNFLRPHKHNNYHVLNDVEILRGADNMPGKWQLLIFLGQQTILNLRKTAAV